MIFYRFKGKDDLFVGKYCSKGAKVWKDITLIPNELLTQKRIDSLKKECPRLNIEKAFEKIDIPKSETHNAFGATFQNGYGPNGKLESINRSKKLKEDIYSIIYDFDDEWAGTGTTEEEFEGTWSELQNYIKQLKKNGCYHIDATCISDCYESKKRSRKVTEKYGTVDFDELWKIYGDDVENFAMKLASKPNVNIWDIEAYLQDKVGKSKASQIMRVVYRNLRDSSIDDVVINPEPHIFRDRSYSRFNKESLNSSKKLRIKEAVGQTLYCVAGFDESENQSYNGGNLVLVSFKSLGDAEDFEEMIVQHVKDAEKQSSYDYDYEDYEDYEDYLDPEYFDVTLGYLDADSDVLYDLNCAGVYTVDIREALNAVDHDNSIIPGFEVVILNQKDIDAHKIIWFENIPDKYYK